MNKRVAVALVVIVLLIGSALAYVALRPTDGEPSAETTYTSDQDEQSPEPGSEAEGRSGTYTTYSEAAFSDTKGTKLLFFHAAWCPQCREIETSIQDGGIPDGVIVFKIDYDTNQALRQKYGVTLQTTFVKVDDQGNKIASYTAYEEPRFSAVERELLP